MSELFMIMGFIFAAYSAVANDSLQTLGTFLSSNRHRPWWLLWLWISGIMVLTITLGWWQNGGDPAFGRLASKGIDFPSDLGVSFNVLYLVAPLTLVIITRFGIPISTSFLLISSFAALTQVQIHLTNKSEGAMKVLEDMMRKSLVGYGLAFASALLIYFFVTGTLEKRFFNQGKEAGKAENHPAWTIFQWTSTGFLWAMWLVQDLANIFVYLPRTIELPHLILALIGMVLLQGYIFREKGGKIQRIVQVKTNTRDIRSATFIDLFYGLVLLFFKFDYIPVWAKALGLAVPWPEKMPMSTTWVFLGLLAGREVALTYKIKHQKNKKLRRFVFGDLGRATAGAVISMIIAIALPVIWLYFNDQLPLDQNDAPNKSSQQIEPSNPPSTPPTSENLKSFLS